MPRDDDEYEDEDFEGDRESDDRSSDDRLIRRAKEKVKVPAIILIIVAVISLLTAGANGVYFFLADAGLDQALADIEADPNDNAQQKQTKRDAIKVFFNIYKIVLAVSAVLGGLSAIITLVGSIQMLKLSGRGLAIMGSILAMPPIVSGCCLLGLPFGIWALVVLSKPEVKSGFAAARRQRNMGYDES